MAYLKFNKDELVNLEYSLKREVLATNRAGGYMSSTIIGCNIPEVPRITDIAYRRIRWGESCVVVEPGRDGHPAWT